MPELRSKSTLAGIISNGLPACDKHGDWGIRINNIALITYLKLRNYKNINRGKHLRKLLSPVYKLQMVMFTNDLE